MLSVAKTVVFDPALLHKYNQPLPRYTSYPPATEMKESFSSRDFEAAVAVGNYKQTPLSLYCHIPFCESACYFCGCNTVITRHKKVADPYLDYLERNIAQVAQRVSNRKVNQLHWGGGTPSYLTKAQVERLWTVLHQHFEFEPEAEISIEVNPRDLDRDYVQFLKDLGFKRVSFGLQDFNLKVQTAVNRIQPEAMLFDAMGWLRQAGFESVNVDLIYGLPYQTLATFRDTIDKTLRLDPDRIAVFNFAYVPWLKPVQKKHIDPATLPGPEEKLEIFHMTIDRLTAAGYQFIGMDHFALADDELAQAQTRGELQRNFQGYSTHARCDLIGLGVSAIGRIGDCYSQNVKDIGAYDASLKQGKLPIERGLVMTEDDRIRSSIIQEIMCNGRLDFGRVSETFEINFRDYFSAELDQLARLEADGLVTLEEIELRVSNRGRLLLRAIAMVFDRYLTADTATKNFSKIV